MAHSLIALNAILKASLFGTRRKMSSVTRQPEIKYIKCNKELACTHCNAIKKLQFPKSLDSSASIVQVHVQFVSSTGVNILVNNLRLVHRTAMKCSCNRSLSAGLVIICITFCSKSLTLSSSVHLFNRGNIYLSLSSLI